MMFYEERTAFRRIGMKDLQPEIVAGSGKTRRLLCWGLMVTSGVSAAAIVVMPLDTIFSISSDTYPTIRAGTSVTFADIHDNFTHL